MKLAVIATAAMLAFATVPAVEAATVTSHPAVAQSSAHVSKVAQKHKKAGTKQKTKKKKSTT